MESISTAQSKPPTPISFGRDCGSNTETYPQFVSVKDLFGPQIHFTQNKRPSSQQNMFTDTPFTNPNFNWNDKSRINSSPFVNCSSPFASGSTSSIPSNLTATIIDPPFHNFQPSQAFPNSQQQEQMSESFTAQQSFDRSIDSARKILKTIIAEQEGLALFQAEITPNLVFAMRDEFEKNGYIFEPIPGDDNWTIRWS
jgi:hypothetical protein